jgi:uncharacterized protein (DUF58 family)
MVTVRQAWLGFALLALLALLIIVAALYWQHLTGASLSHLLAISPLGDSGSTGQGC